MIRVLIADDQSLMRAALRGCLEAVAGIEVVGEAVDGQDALEAAARLKPDVVLMDLRMPRLDGVEATRQLASPLAEHPVKVLVVTTFNLDEYVFEALRAGASGFLLKDATGEEVVHAVRVVADGDALLAPTVTRQLLDRYARTLPRAVPAADLTAGLTDREVDVLRLVSHGLSTVEIADELHVAPSSVKTHIGHLLDKLGVPDRLHLVIYAYENGLIQPGGHFVPSDDVDR
jgi:DNA-binding NarL/FixJ family response regulator